MYPGTYAAEAPDRIAAVMADTGETLSYGELERRSVQLAHVLHEAGLRPGDVVALLTENNLRAFEVYWAALRSGLYITAVNNHLKADEVAYIVSDSGATALVVSAEQAVTAEAITGLTAGVKLRLAYGGPVKDHDSYEETLAAASGGAVRRPAARRHHAVLLGHDGTAQGSPPDAARPPGVRARRYPGGPGRPVLRRQSRLGLPIARPDLPRGPAALVRRDPGPRRHRGDDEAVRRRTGAARHSGPARHPCAVRPDDVRPHAAAAAGNPRPLRRLQPEGRHPRRGAMPGRGQAEDDRAGGVRSWWSTTPAPRATA